MVTAYPQVTDNWLDAAEGDRCRCGHIRADHDPADPTAGCLVGIFWQHPDPEPSYRWVMCGCPDFEVWSPGELAEALGR